MPGLVFGPHLPPLKIKDLKVKKRLKKEKKTMMERRSDRQEREEKRKERLQRRAAKREEEKQRRAEGGDAEVKKAKTKKRDTKSNHGTEQVDAVILKLLGKSHKSKIVAGKGKKGVVGQKKVDSKGTVGTKWRPGMRGEGGDKMQRRQRIQQRRKLMKRAQAERSLKKREANTSEVFIADIVSDLVANLPVSGAKKVPKTEKDKNVAMTETEEDESLAMPKTEKDKSLATSSEDEMVVMVDIGTDSEEDLKERLKSSVQQAFEETQTSEHPSPPPSFEETLKSEQPSTPPSFEETLKSEPPSPPPSFEETQTSQHSSPPPSFEEKPKRYVKRRVKKANPPHESSDEEEEEERPMRPRRRKGFLRQVDPSPSLTESSGGETPYLADSSDDEEEEARVGQTGGQIGSMKGGSGESYEALLTVAILKSGENVKLDEPTRGDGSCFSHAIVQQSRRCSVGLFLKSRGKTISDFMHLKKSVAEFIKTNTKSQKVESLRVNFEVSQLNMYREGRRRRSWREYWSDMQKHGEDEKYWADDIFLQATAWYLNLPIRIIYAGDDTGGRIAATTDGDFFPPIDGEQRPLLYLGYIVNEHYQSLLPVVEDDYVPPPGLAQPAVGNALQNALQALLEEKAKQGTEVSS